MSGNASSGGATRWAPGQSGNPSGKPKRMIEIEIDGEKVLISFADACRNHAKEALDVTLEIMRDKTVAPAVRLDAAKDIKDRAFGRPTQAVELTGANGGPIEYANLTDEEVDARIAAIVGPEPDSRTSH